MSDETTTTALTFVACTIQVENPLKKTERLGYQGKEAKATGLGYYITYPHEEKLPYQYHIVHLQSGRTLVPNMDLYDEKTVVDSIEEIVRAHLADWTLPVDELYASIGNKQVMIDALRGITRRLEKADTLAHIRDFTFPYTLRGGITIRSTSREEAEEIARQVLDEITVDDDEVENFLIDEIDLD